MNTADKIIGSYTIPTWAFFEWSKLAVSRHKLTQAKVVAVNGGYLVATDGHLLLTLRISDMVGVIPEHVYSDEIFSVAREALTTPRRHAGRMHFVIRRSQDGQSYLETLWSLGHGEEVSFTTRLDHSEYINWRLAVPERTDKDQQHAEAPCLAVKYLTAAQAIWAYSLDTKRDRMHLRLTRTQAIEGRPPAYLVEPSILSPEMRRVVGLRILCMPIVLGARRGDRTV